MDLELSPRDELRWDIDGTGAGDGVDPKLRLKSYNPIIDLEQDPDLEWPPLQVTSLWYSYGKKIIRW